MRASPARLFPLLLLLAPTIAAVAEDADPRSDSLGQPLGEGSTPGETVLIAALPLAFAPRSTLLVSVSGPTNFGPALATRKEETVLSTRREQDRVYDVRVEAAALIEGDDLVIRLNIQDNCLTRVVTVVEVRSIQEGVGGAHARTTMRWVGIGALSVAGLGLISPVTVDGAPAANPLVAKALYVGAFGGIGAFTLVRAHEMRAQIKDIHTEERPGPWVTEPCASEHLDGRTLNVTAEANGESIAVGSGTTDGKGTLRLPLEQFAPTLLTAVGIMPPHESPHLLVQQDAGKAVYVVMPKELVEPAAGARAHYADAKVAALVGEAKRAAKSGDFEQAEQYLVAANGWTDSQAADILVQNGEADIERQRLAITRARWAREEGPALAICAQSRHTVEALKATARQMAYVDQGAAEAWVGENRDKYETSLARKRTALETLSMIYDEMGAMGVPESERIQVVRRTQAACGD